MKFTKTLFQHLLTSLIVAIIILVAGLSLLTKKFPPDVQQILDFQKQIKTITQPDRTAELLKQIEDSSPGTPKTLFITEPQEVEASAASAAEKVRLATAQSQLQSAQLVEIQSLKEEIFKLRKENEALREKLRVDR